MRKRNIQKHFRVTAEEAAALKAKASAVGLSETALLRALVNGYRPREKPDARFYEFQRELTAIGNNVNQLAAKANSLGYIDATMLMEEAERWAEFQTMVQERFLLPEKDNMKWQ